MNIFFILSIGFLRCSDLNNFFVELLNDINNPTSTEEDQSKKVEDIADPNWFTVPTSLDEVIQLKINSKPLETLDIRKLETLGDTPYIAWLSSFSGIFICKEALRETEFRKHLLNLVFIMISRNRQELNLPKSNRALSQFLVNNVLVEKLENNINSFFKFIHDNLQPSELRKQITPNNILEENIKSCNNMILKNFPCIEFYQAEMNGIQMCKGALLKAFRDPKKVKLYNEVSELALKQLGNFFSMLVIKGVSTIFKNESRQLRPMLIESINNYINKTKPYNIFSSY